MRVLGVDPGKQGGLAIVEETVSSVPMCVVESMPMPLVGKAIDWHEVAAFCQDQRIERAVIERQTSFLQGRTSAFTSGVGVGGFLGIFAAEEIPYEMPTPPMWKKAVLAGTDRDKAAAIAYVKRTFPVFAANGLTPGMRTKSHDGIADAICLAVYGTRAKQ